MTRNVWGSTDSHALRLIAEGRILVDPATGVVLVDGAPRGISDKQRGYQRIFAAGVLLQAHRVVWLFVHGPIPEGHVINHRDSNRRNNRIGNLEAITHKQNIHHAHRLATYVGTYPDDVVDPDVVARAADLAARGDATQAEVLALLGIVAEDERRDDDTDTEFIMQSAYGCEPRHARRLA